MVYRVEKESLIVIQLRATIEGAGPGGRNFAEVAISKCQISKEYGTISEVGKRVAIDQEISPL